MAEKKVASKKIKKKWRVFLIIAIAVSSVITTVFVGSSIFFKLVDQGEIELRNDIGKYLNNDFCLLLDYRDEDTKMYFPDGNVKKVPYRYRNNAYLLAASQDELLFRVSESSGNALIEVTDWSFDLKRVLLWFDNREYYFKLLNNGFVLYKNSDNDGGYIVNIETGETFDYNPQFDVPFYTNIYEYENRYVIKSIGVQTIEFSIGYESIDSEFLSAIKKWGYKLEGFDNLFDGTYCCIFNRPKNISNGRAAPNIPLYMQINERGEILKYHTYGIIPDEEGGKVIGVREQIAESFNFA